MRADLPTSFLIWASEIEKKKEAKKKRLF